MNDSLQPVSQGLVDANLLAVWIIGQISEEEVPKNSRTRAYSVADYRLLAAYLARFNVVVITPNIATEASNLIGSSSLYGNHLSKARSILAHGVRIWSEKYVKSEDAVASPEYLRLGLTDAAIIQLAVEGLEVLTDDFDLYRSLLSRGVTATNFTHIRTSGWID